MKTCLIFLLLIAISNIDLDGYSAIDIYKYILTTEIKSYLYFLTCEQKEKRYAVYMCKTNETYAKRCGEIIDYIDSICQKSASHRASQEEDRPMTQEEEEIDKSKKIEVLKKKLYDEYFPKLLENYSSTEAMRQIKKVLDLLTKEPIVHN